MKLKKYILLIIACVCGAIESSADVTLPAKCEVKQPKALSTPLIKQQSIDDFLKKGESGDWGQSDAKNDYWNVYSDRDDNVTYRDPNIRSPKHTTLKMNDAVRIAKIQNGFALVYEEELHPSFPQISKAKSLGWVPMDHLLLWKSCPTNEAGFYNQVLIAKNLDKANNSNRKDLFKYYRNPEMRQKGISLQSTMDFFYVMKKSDGLVLLAGESKMLRRTSRVLLGWVSEANYVLCNQRTFLEPNWDHGVAETFEGKNVTVYKDASLSSPQIGKVPLGIKNELGRVSTMYRMHPETMRYKLLNNDSGNDAFYKIVFFASPSGSKRNETELVACQGYVEKREVETGYEYWKPVIYISQDELNELIFKFSPVLNNVDSKDRMPYVEAIKQVAQTIAGNNDVSTMTDKEIRVLIASLDAQSAAMQSGRTLGQILDPKIVKPAEFKAMLQEFKAKSHTIYNIQVAGYKFSAKRNGTRWYWIPVEDLP